MAAGDFNSLPIDKSSKEMLSEAYNLVTEMNLWDWLKNPNTPGERGFMFCHDPEIEKISEKMNIGHSGSTFAFTMRVMEMIAKNGWDSYVKTIMDKKYRVKWLQASTGEKGVVHLTFSSYHDARSFVNKQYGLDDNTIWTIECVST